MIHAFQWKGRRFFRVLGVIGFTSALCLATAEMNSTRSIAQDSSTSSVRRAESSTLSGQILDPDDKPVAKAVVEAFSVSPDARFHIRTETDSDGKWTANRDKGSGQLWAKSIDGKLATVVRLSASDNEVTLHLKPTAEARGRLVDAEGKPAPEQELRYGILIHDDEMNPESPFVLAFGGVTQTDSDGIYRLTALVPGQKYDVDLPLGGSRKGKIAVAAPQRAETVELGDATMPNSFRGPTIAERVNQYFNQPDELAKRIAQSRKFAAPQALRLLLIVGDPSSETARKFVEMRFGGYPKLFELLNDYEQLAVSTEDSAAMSVLKNEYGLDAKQLAPLSLVILGDAHEVIATKNWTTIASGDGKSFDAEFSQFVSSHALVRPDAQELLAAGLDRARREGKLVLLEESGTYCGWCRILARFIDRHAEIFDANFVPVRIDASRFVHGEEVMKRYRSGDGGIPWCAILDSSGTKVADWDSPDGNIGYPAEPKEREYFLKIMSTSVPKITPEQLEELRSDLEAEAKKYLSH
jgi:hypothetical protein